MNIGMRLQELRKARKISVYRLSKLADVSENHIHNIENSVKQPTICMLEKLLGPLQVTLAEFFYEGGEVVYPTENEKELLYHFRQLDTEKSSAVLNLAKMLHNE